MAVMAAVTLFLRVVLCYLVAFYRFFFPRPSKDIKGQVVLVTGAGRGIGKSLAIQFHRRGAKLALCDIDGEGVKQTADEIEAMGGVAFAYQCDVGKYDDIQKTAAKVKTQLGNVDILVNNAAVSLFKSILHLSRDEVETTMHVNIMSSFWMVQQFLPSMLEKNYGHIVTMSSIAGKFGMPMLSDYGASKFALFGFTESLAEEIRTVYRKPGVQTTIVCPSFVQTSMIAVDVSDRPIRFHPGDALCPDGVAVDILDGILRNRKEIYLPPSMTAIDAFRAILPVRARPLFIDSILGIKTQA